MQGCISVAATWERLLLRSTDGQPWRGSTTPPQSSPTLRLSSDASDHLSCPLSTSSAAVIVCKRDAVTCPAAAACCTASIAPAWTPTAHCLHVGDRLHPDIAVVAGCPSASPNALPPLSPHSIAMFNAAIKEHKARQQQNKAHIGQPTRHGSRRLSSCALPLSAHQTPHPPLSPACAPLSCAAECRAALMSSVESFSAEVMDDLNAGMLEVLSNQKKIEQETQRLQLQTAQLTKSTALTLPSLPSLDVLVLMSLVCAVCVVCVAVQASGSLGVELCGDQ